MSAEANSIEIADIVQPSQQQSEALSNDDESMMVSDAKAAGINKSTETEFDKGSPERSIELICEKLKSEVDVESSVVTTDECASDAFDSFVDEYKVETETSEVEETLVQSHTGMEIELKVEETHLGENKIGEEHSGEKGELTVLGEEIFDINTKKDIENLDMEVVDSKADITKGKSSKSEDIEKTTSTGVAKEVKLYTEKSEIETESQLHVQLESKPSTQPDVSSNSTDDGVHALEKSCAEEVSGSGNEGSDIFYDKQCINCECPKKHKQFLNASLFSLNYFKVNRKTHKQQYVCVDCYDQALQVYEQYAGLLVRKQPLLLHDLVSKRYDYVEIDSSDDDDTSEDPGSAIGSAQFSTKDLQLIENELEDSIKMVFENIDIRSQLTWSKAVLSNRSHHLQRKFNKANDELMRVQEIAERLQNTLNRVSQIEVKQLPPFEITCELQMDLHSIPPAGEIQRPVIKIGGTYYAVKNKAIASWVPCRVVEQTENLIIIGCNSKSYKIKYLMSQYQILKTVSAKHVAYYDPPQVRLTIGTRVIAYFDATTLSRGKEKVLAQSAFYPGIIAEPLKQANKFRYLIFYDDGYTQYVQHNDVRLVCQASDKVWEDVHPASRDFIQKYVEQYSVNRPMVQTQKGQSMNTESNGTWLYARVIDIDCSLVLMQFEGPKNHTEWIYRGSLRLGPVFKEYQKSLEKNAITQQSRLPRRTEPFIRYTEDMEASSTQAVQHQRALAKKSVSRQNSNVAASTTSATPPSVRHLNNSTIYVDDENRPKGQVIFYTAKRNLPPQSYQPHTCNPSCLYKTMTKLNGYSPLAKPLLSGWERMKYKQKIKRSIVYRAPCGKSLRNIEEVRCYLRATNNVLNVENFDFCPDLHCLAEYVIESAIVQKRDISNGQEKIAIPLVNYYDNTLPPPCTYAAQRIPTEGVFLNLDEEFLPGCDCEDDCSDKSKCSCWKLTIEGIRFCNPNKPIEEIGYQYKRLLEHVATGIYECNSRCKCQSNCLNRVVQHSLEMKLQVFKTSNRGWGLRCINDIPKGAFICIYAGHLLTETKANEGGIDAGDEYFADLDYIEVAEQLKEGYESDVERSEPEEEEEDTTYQPEPDDDDDEFRPNKYYTKRGKHKERASRLSNQSQTGEEDSQERQVISFNPNAAMDENVRENSVRRLFDKDEAPYIMDAKTTGNLGRYFNHSCSPNLFVQNVFVDTHDLRFPWVAFFAAVHIRSGTELTWNYNYEVGVVPGKVLYCQCGAPNCRIRLL